MNPTAQFPEQRSGKVSCNSWVVYHPERTFETFDRDTALAQFTKGVPVKTAYQHLIDFNQGILEERS